MITHARRSPIATSFTPAASPLLPDARALGHAAVLALYDELALSLIHI